MIKLALKIGLGIFVYTLFTSGTIAAITMLGPITMGIIGLTVLGFS